MSLVPCKECKAQISSEAAKCPQCGAKQRASWVKVLVVGVLGVSVLAGVVGVVTGPDEAPRQAAPVAKTPEQLKREADFQRVLAVARSVKAAAKSPDSFKLETALMTDAGTVCVSYRATNSFNAVVPGFASSREGKISTNGGDWNRHCAGKEGVDFLHVRQGL